MIKAVLDVCWPEFAAEFCTIDQPTLRALLERWPVAADLAQASARAVHHLVRTVSRNHIPPAQIRRLRALARGSVAVPHGLVACRTEVRRLLAR
ncbi:MAG TPA: hypothetical protein VFS11_11370 [Gemmatimonadales bacterium]|nr:hypothetical protein [Gemmatimonadales bacterium]